MSLPELIGLMQRLGISTKDVEDRVTAAYTRLIAVASDLTDQ